MDNRFFERPILNSPYEYPARTGSLMPKASRPSRSSKPAVAPSSSPPFPSPRKRKGPPAQQADLVFDEGKGLSTQDAAIRPHADHQRTPQPCGSVAKPPESERLAGDARNRPAASALAASHFSSITPFFCQIEAVETAIWLTEVAPKIGKSRKRFLEHLANANNDANPEFMRLALKLATGAGKTTVMAMLIAWQTINAVRRPGSKKFTRGFLVVTPGITITDRLRVLQPNDPDSYYQSRELVPGDMLARPGTGQDRHHQLPRLQAPRADGAFQGWAVPAPGRRGEALNTLETEGQMLQRVMPDLMGMKNILVINDEAHHCYREKPEQRRGGGPEGRRQEGGGEEQRGGPALDLRPGNRQPQTRHDPGHSTCRPRPFSCAAPAMPRAPSSPGR